MLEISLYLISINIPQGSPEGVAAGTSKKSYTWRLDINESWVYIKYKPDLRLISIDICHSLIMSRYETKHLY